MARSVRSLLFAVLVAAGLSTVGATTTEVRAATPDLTIVGDARYEVLPDRRRVHVTVDLTLTNRLEDTTTRRYFFDEAFLAVLPGTSGFRVTGGGDGSPSVRATSRTKERTLLRIDFAERLYSGRSASYRLSFDLRDPGGRPSRQVRVGDSLVSFPVWGFASDDTTGGSVTVVFPKGFDVEVQSGRFASATMTDSGRTVLRSGRLSAPLSFFAYVVADRAGAYRETTIETEVSGVEARVLLRAWPDDRPWAKRVGSLLERALPVLGERIGLPWPQAGALTVQEALSRTTGGYAGLFDPAESRVEIAYHAGDFVVLHEAAHTWFNGSLLADRWANEAFASYYAERAAEELEIKSRPAPLTDELEDARVPLNAWGPVGEESRTVEDAAYAASLELARAIGRRAGDEGLAEVWAAAADHAGPYQPASGPLERMSGPPDWRTLLDLLEERTDRTYDDLWRAWVARDADLPLLDARQAARAQYASVLADTRGWTLPDEVRASLRAWHFDEAGVMLDGAAAALERRVTVETAIRDAGLAVPVGLRQAFENDASFDDVRVEANAELEAVDRYAEAVALRPTPSEGSPILALGLWNETPDVALDQARGAFARGDLDASIAHSQEAATIWGSAGPVGQGRAASLAMLAAAVALVVLMIVVARRQRRRRRSRMMATPIRR